MAETQQNINVAAPGFNGVNTQLSPLGLGPEWARQADNCVIDQYGRVGARQGHTVLNSSNTILSGEAITCVYKFYDDGLGANRTLSTGNNLIMSGEATLTDITPVASTVTADDWQAVQLGDDVYLVQAGHDMVMWDSSAQSCLRVTDHASSASVPASPTCALAAFGKLWVAKDSTVYWSDTLIGMAFSGGASGSINLQTVWPQGHDEVVALYEFNNFLVIFGKRSILVYGGAESPASMSLSDVITGIGCAARDSIASIGTDLLFLDYNGVRSLGRVIQEKSSPIGDISSNVHTDVVDALRGETSFIRGEYSGDNGFYILSFPTTLQVFCFDLRNGRLPDGSARTTIWTGLSVTAVYDFVDTLYLGNYNGVCTYGGYTDGTDTYRIRYYTHPQDFGAPSRLKFPKQLDYHIVGGWAQSVSLSWGFGYEGSYKYKTFTLGAGDTYEYGVAEYNIAEYAVSAEIATPHVNTSGSGRSVSMGLEATINGTALSVQEMNLQTLIGRII